MTDTNSPGLVICAITAHDTPTYQPRFATEQQVQDAASALTTSTPETGLHRYAVEVSPGSVRITRTTSDAPPKTENYKVRTSINRWSAKSRARMIARLCSLDYAPLLTDTTRLPAMITLTYPGDWLTVAPDGATIKKHLHAFRLRYERRFGETLRAVWKMEFQRRGAPHFHLFCVPPATPDFRTWLSDAWADIVAHPDPDERARHRLAGTGLDFEAGLRSYDPKRVAVYFAKHGSANLGAKEYQNKPPVEWAETSPGRFWGYWGMKPCTASAPVTEAEALTLARTLRRWARANAITTRKRVPRVSARTGEVTWRTVTRRQPPRMTNRIGFISTKNGPALAHDLARSLDVREGAGRGC